MTSRDFCYWLQGHFEISKTKVLGERETEMVKRHLALVFKHEIDPSIDKGKKKLKKELQDIHDELNKPKPHHETQYRC